MQPLHALQALWNYPVIPGMPGAPPILGMGEAIATLTGAAGVWLAARNLVSNFGWNIVSSVLFAIVFWQSGLHSSALLQLVGFLPLLAWGWVLWSRHRDTPSSEDKPGVLPITRLSHKGWTGLIGFVLLVTPLWAWAMKQTGAEQTFIDAGVTVGSIAGQYLQSRRILENWHVWLVVNGIYVFYLLPAQKLWFSTGLYAVFLALAAYGFYQWQRELKITHHPADVPAR